jgi:hypothetical protein
VRASTDKGDIQIKAVNWDDWQLTSRSGNIRAEVPLDAKFRANLLPSSGVSSVWRPDMNEPDEGAHELLQSVNGGGKRNEARSDTANISVE